MTQLHPESGASGEKDPLIRGEQMLEADAGERWGLFKAGGGSRGERIRGAVCFKSPLNRRPNHRGSCQGTEGGRGGGISLLISKLKTVCGHSPPTLSHSVCGATYTACAS